MINCIEPEEQSYYEKKKLPLMTALNVRNKPIMRKKLPLVINCIDLNNQAQDG